MVGRVEHVERVEGEEIKVKGEGEEGKGYLLALRADDLGRPSQQVCRRNALKNF